MAVVKINSVTELDNKTTFKIIIDGDGTTEHDVSVQKSYLDELGLDDVAPEEIVLESVEFLLKKESNQTILRSFDISQIPSYFPEFKDYISKKL